MFTHWTQSDLTVNGIQMHFTRTGNGEKRPLVLVHGFSDNGLCWTPVAQDLESEYDVIMPDMRGHGLSARVQPGEKVDMPADLAALIRALGLERPIVAGHSMGAMVTYQIGVRSPELASALVLEDPPWWLPQPASETPVENPIAAWARSLQNRTLDDLLVEYRQEHPNWPETLIVPMCNSKKQLDPNIVDIMTGRLNSDRTDWLKTLGGISVPMLVFTADASLGAIVTPEAARKACELNPKMTLVNIPNVGHLIRFDKYPEFMEVLRAFLKTL